MSERLTLRFSENEALNVANAQGEGLKTVRLAPWGEVTANGTSFVVDDAAVEETGREFAAHGVELPIDIEHESLPDHVPASGSRGAVGWITKLWGEAERGLMSLIRWSPHGRELIRAQAFQYVSPVLLIRKDDRRVVGVHSAALTTKPAIPKMERLAASANAPLDPKNDDTDIASMAAVRAELMTLRAEVEQLRGCESKITEQYEEKIAATAVDGLMENAFREHKLFRNSEEARLYRKIAERDQEEFKQLIAVKRAHVMPGMTKPPSPEVLKRDKTIRDAACKFRDNGALNRLTTARAYVNSELIGKQESKLTDEECHQFAIV